MAARSLGLAATLGLVANAFLLPPVSIDSVNEDTKADADLATWTLVNPYAQPLLLSCAGCEQDSKGPASLFLNISVGPQPGTLEMGGNVFFAPPAALLRSGLETDPEGLVIPIGESITDVTSSPEDYPTVRISNWRLAVHESQSPSARGEELLSLTMDIFEINKHSVSVPRIELKALNDPELGMMILSTELVETERGTATSVVGHEVEKGHAIEESCKSALCQWRQFINDKIYSVGATAHSKLGHGRPCPGRMGKGMKDGIPHGPFTSMHHGPGSHHHRPIGEAGRPHHHPHHHNHHPGHMRHHHGFHHFLHRAGRFILAVAVPIMIGIAAGVATYAIGVVFGCLIALIWIKVFRGGKRGYASVAQTEEDAALKVDGAEEPRESFESAPPMYEDAPAYEEKEVV